MISKKNSGFTLMEIVIIIALIALLAVATIILLNPLQQINKARDSQKKSNLDQLRKTFEDFYNDKGCYPKPSEVCYNAQLSYAPLEAIACNICGNESAPPNFSNFSPYLKELPCDPNSPRKKYFYQVDNKDCPKWFRLYSELNIETDPIISDLDCNSKSCGPKPGFGYNFGVTSPNIDLEKSNDFYCYSRENSCDNCGLYTNCIDPDISAGCQSYKKFYPNYSSCCTNHNICGTNVYYCKYSVTDECILCGYTYQECRDTNKCSPFTIRYNRPLCN